MFVDYFQLGAMETLREQFAVVIGNNLMPDCLQSDTVDEMLARFDCACNTWSAPRPSQASRGCAVFKQEVPPL